MILIPIGQEDNTVKRLPWVTYGVMIICAVAFVLTGFGSPPIDPAANQALEEAVQYFFTHPHLELDPEMRALIFQGADENTQEVIMESAKEFAERRPSSAYELSEQQAHLDELTATGLEGLRKHGFFKWGLVPSRLSPVALVTHMFLHGGWMHLLGNMLMLFLAGPFIEDVWGRPLYGGFYLISGFAAALSFAALDMDSATPMIGASGAIAGVMGAFLIRYRSNRIRFFYMVGFLWRGTFFAPAWLMLPLWFGQQIFMFLLTKDMGGGGVAYMAHIGGFAFGMVVALGIAKAGLEEKYIASSIEGKITIINNAVIDEALQADHAGRTEEAYTMLAEAWKQDPTNRDVAISLWDLAGRHGWAAHTAPVMLRLIEEDLRNQQTATALENWYDVVRRVSDLVPEPALSIRMGQLLNQAGQRDWALDAFRRSLQVPPEKLNGSMLLRVAMQCRDLDQNLASAAAAAALARPDLQPAERGQAEQIARPTQAAPVS